MKPPEKPPQEKRRMIRPPSGGEEGGRTIAARLKSGKHHTPSSQAWLNRQLNDPFVAEARAKGYRSRAAFKLSEIDDKFHFLHRGSKVIDLGCAPGGWLQVSLQRGAGAVAGVDLLDVEPLMPAHILKMDFTEPECGKQLIDLLGGRPDVVLSDMAPNTMGHRKTDHLRIIGLIEIAADFAIANLAPGGAFITKAFQGGETSDILRLLKSHFTEVKHFKPRASRSDSSELYLVATGKIERGLVPSLT